MPFHASQEPSTPPPQSDIATDPYRHGGLATIPSASGQTSLAAQLNRCPNPIFANEDWMVLCHGLMAHRNIRQFQTLIKHAPINTLAFDFHSNGDSTGAKEDWSLGGYQREAYDDLQGVVTWIEQHGGRVLIILGHSRGASVVLMHSMEFDHVPYVLSLAARYDPSTGLDPYFKPGDRERLLTGEVHVVECQKKFSDGIPRFISAKCLKQRLDIDMTKLCNLQHTRAVFFVHGTGDETIPCTHARKLAEALAGQPRITEQNGDDNCAIQVTNPHGVLGFTKILADADHSLKSPNGKKGFEPLLELMSSVYDQIKSIEQTPAP